MQQYYLEEKEVSHFLMALKADFELLETVDSTNNYLKERIKSGALCKTTAVVAIEQTKGRGTRGRKWISDKDSCLKLSLAIPVKPVTATTVAASPAVTLELCQKFWQRGHTDIQLKWPNDLIRNDGKLAGVLLETVKQKGQTFLVIGIGINLFPNQSLEQTIDRKIAFLFDQSPKNPCAVRTDIAKIITARTIGTIAKVEANNTIENYKSWEKYDYLLGKKIKVRLNSELKIEGIDLGIDDQGRLLVQTESGETKSLQLGEIEI